MVEDADQPDPGILAAVEAALGQQDFSAYVEVDAELVGTEEEIVAEKRSMLLIKKWMKTKKATESFSLERSQLLKCWSTFQA